MINAVMIKLIVSYKCPSNEGLCRVKLLDPVIHESDPGDWTTQYVKVTCPACSQEHKVCLHE